MSRKVISLDENITLIEGEDIALGYFVDIIDSRYEDMDEQGEGFLVEASSEFGFMKNLINIEYDDLMNNLGVIIEKCNDFIASLTQVILPEIMEPPSGLLSDDIIPVSPMSLEEASNGREVKTYPFKYDAFDGLDNMEEWLSMKIRKGDFKPSWLNYREYSACPLNIGSIYYTPASVFEVLIIDPNGETRFNQNEHVLFTLNPEDWNLESVKSIINSINKLP